MKEKLFEVRTEIKTRAGEIVTATKQKGKAALNKCRITEYLSKIREEVERKKKRWDMMGNGGITRDIAVFKY